MNFGISNISWSINSDKEILQFLRDNNVNFLEIAPTKLTQDPFSHIEFFTQYLEKNDSFSIFSIQSICFGKNFNFFRSNNEYNEFINHMEGVLKFCNKLKIQNIVFGCPKNRNLEDSKNLNLAVDFFSELDAIASYYDIIIALEPNPEIYGTNFLNKTMDVVDFITTNNFEKIKINFDFGSFLYNQEKIEEIESYINLINHVHISEPNLNLIENYSQIEILINKLKSLNYKKGLSIEMKENSIENVIETVLKIKNLI
jgi:sugar phosphate isomerase/epimerase